SRLYIRGRSKDAILDLPQVDPLTAHLDLCISASEENDIPRRVVAHNITSPIEPALLVRCPCQTLDECILRLDQVPEITSSENGPLYQQFTHRSDRDQTIRVVDGRHPVSCVEWAAKIVQLTGQAVAGKGA